MNINKGQFKKKQGFKGTCRICGKYGLKAADCWENEKTRRKMDLKDSKGNVIIVAYMVIKKLTVERRR